jgi:hypothetical protein
MINSSAITPLTPSLPSPFHHDGLEPLRRGRFLAPKGSSMTPTETGGMKAYEAGGMFHAPAEFSSVDIGA